MGVPQEFQSSPGLEKSARWDYDVDVYDWLCHHAGDGGAAYMLKGMGKAVQNRGQERRDLLEMRKPSGIVRLDKGYCHLFGMFQATIR